MRNTWAVCKREFGEYFATPVGYIVVGTYAAIVGLAFVSSFILYAEISKSPGSRGYTGVPNFEETLLSPMLVFMGQVMMFLGPLITMRLLAEETNRGTMELLMTQPLRDREIIFGKYLAALGVLLVMMSIVAIHMGTVAYYTDVEPAVLALGVLAVFLMGAAFVSMGLFVSAITSNQITAATVTFGVWLVPYIIGSFGGRETSEDKVPSTLSEPARDIYVFLRDLAHNILVELPIDAHAKTMAQGVVQLKDIVYYPLFIAFFLFLTFRALESRKWRA
jgi:ABC-2 type transport system permease protein